MLKEKTTNKRRRLYHFTDLIKDFNYYDYRLATIDNARGVVYALDTYKINMDRLRDIERAYDNTKIIRTFCEYAPEIKKVWLFISK